MRVLFLIGHLVKERDLILYELAESISKYGADVVSVSGFPSRRLEKEVVQYYLNNPTEVINDHFISIHVGNKHGEGNGLFNRMLKYICLSLAIYRQTKKEKYDVVYIYSTPPFLGYLSKKLSKKAPVVYNAQDLFPDSLKTALGISDKNILIRLLRVFERKIYKNSQRVITISEDMRKHIIKYGADKEKTIVIHNWADTEIIHPVDRNDNILFDEYSINREKFIILYAGDIGLHQRLDIFVDAAERLKDNEKIEFVFFGNGAYEFELKELVKRKGLQNFKIFPFQPVERISMVYSLGNIDVVALEKGMTELALPSKVWSIMAAGRPILGAIDSESELANSIDGKYGFILKEWTGEEVARVVGLIEKNHLELNQMGSNARVNVVNNHSRSKQTYKYYEVLQKVIDEWGDNK